MQLNCFTAISSAMLTSPDRHKMLRIFLRQALVPEESDAKSSASMQVVLFFALTKTDRLKAKNEDDAEAEAGLEPSETVSPRVSYASKEERQQVHDGIVKEMLQVANGARAQMPISIYSWQNIMATVRILKKSTGAGYGKVAQLLTVWTES